jgi:hypothetical protein
MEGVKFYPANLVEIIGVIERAAGGRLQFDCSYEISFGDPHQTKLTIRCCRIIDSQSSGSASGSSPSLLVP